MTMNYNPSKKETELIREALFEFNREKVGDASADDGVSPSHIKIVPAAVHKDNVPDMRQILALGKGAGDAVIGHQSVKNQRVCLANTLAVFQKAVSIVDLVVGVGAPLYPLALRLGRLYDSCYGVPRLQGWFHR